ncbi:MAG TPA: TetR family transcriptional regulator, partial [Gimesia maris]|nr:TetR family transcriptional regulator [Gimesia maris]
MTPPTDRKTRSRKNILNAALRMFKRQGYVGSGVDGIMEEA